MCYYCGVERAGYIPDGAHGPMCTKCQDRHHILARYESAVTMLAHWQDHVKIGLLWQHREKIVSFLDS